MVGTSPLGLPGPRSGQSDALPGDIPARLPQRQTLLSLPRSFPQLLRLGLPELHPPGSLPAWGPRSCPRGAVPGAEIVAQREEYILEELEEPRPRPTTQSHRPALGALLLAQGHPPRVLALLPRAAGLPHAPLHSEMPPAKDPSPPLPCSESQHEHHRAPRRPGPRNHARWAATAAAASQQHLAQQSPVVGAQDPRRGEGPLPPPLPPPPPLAAQAWSLAGRSSERGRRVQRRQRTGTRGAQ
mmetsp:Transcript_25545/g.74521  ORF Transcript_25545/g.74521 Transcript_25545/m.74521 type:complete len:242 (-) Transcript_25545:253-978(-)